VSGHDPRAHEPLLEAILTGEEDPVAALSRSEIADCAECRAELDALVALQARLDSASARERADLAALVEHAGEVGTGRALAALRSEIQATTRGAPAGEPPHNELRYLWGGLIVAAALVLLLVLPVLLRERLDDGAVLGGAVRILHPVGEVEAFSPIEWEDVRPAGGEYRVTVQRWDTLLSGWENGDESGPLTEPRWALPDYSWWGRKIRVDVYVYGPEDARTPVSQGWSEAELVSPD
jgi:hypothetical protein